MSGPPTSVPPGLILSFRGHTPRISENAFIAPNATVIGRVEIGDRSGIWFGCVLRGDVTVIHVGAFTNIQDGTVIHGTRDSGDTVWIGDHVSIGHQALIHGCRLEDGSFVGMKACVMDGVVVETGGFVAAGAVVTQGKRVKAGEVWAGTPAKFWRKVTPAEQRLIEGTAAHYATLASDYS